mgnify:CR=1 FL=1
MTQRIRTTTLASVVAAALFLVVAASPAAAYDFPSTNDANRAAGLPHVNLVSAGLTSVTLEFVNPTASLAFFEYRIDGEAAGTTPHPVVIGDVIHPGVCVDGRPAPAPACSSDSIVRTFEATDLVEVRLALGGERDWDFDWTPFPVREITKDDCKHGGWRELGFRNQGQCIRFVNEQGHDHDHDGGHGLGGHD